MFVWKKQVEQKWLNAHEEELCAHFGSALAIIRRPERKRIQLEIACHSGKQARELTKNFGGRLEKLPRDWLKKFAREQRSKPLRIGKRLVVFNVGGTHSSDAQ